MPPVTHTLIVSVRAPVEQVFALLTDPGRMPEWLPGCTGAQSNGPLKHGARIKVRFGERLTEFEIVDFARPATLGWAERGARKGWKRFVRLDTTGESTAITIRDVWIPHSLGAWFHMRFLERRRVRSLLNQILQNLRSGLARKADGHP